MSNVYTFHHYTILSLKKSFLEKYRISQTPLAHNLKHTHESGFHYIKFNNSAKWTKCLLGTRHYAWRWFKKMVKKQIWFLHSWNLESTKGRCLGRHWAYKQTDIYNYLFWWILWRQKIGCYEKEKWGGYIIYIITSRKAPLREEYVS